MTLTQINQTFASAPSTPGPGVTLPPAPSNSGASASQSAAPLPWWEVALQGAAQTVGQVADGMVTMSPSQLMAAGQTVYGGVTGAVTGGAAGAEAGIKAASSPSSLTFMGIKISSWWDIALVILGAVLVVKALIDAAAQTKTGSTVIEATKSTVKDAAAAAMAG